MIFTWLRREDRLAEKTKVYGITRSWSKFGGAFSLLPATACVFLLQDYAWVFWLSMIPYVLGIINFLGYPSWLDGPRQEGSVGAVVLHLRKALQMVLAEARLRRLVLESMTYEGMFKAGKDYLQPVVRQAAVALPVLVTLDSESRTALLIGVVFFVANLVSALGSRRSHLLAEKCGGEDTGVKVVWRWSFLTYLVLIPLLLVGWEMVAVAGFLVLYLLQNLFRPMHISRIDEFSDEKTGATVLSVESQAKTLATMVVAPLLGAAVDLVGTRGTEAFWPVGVAGALLAGIMLLTMRRERNRS
jgi:hypothetical protein